MTKKYLLLTVFLIALFAAINITPLKSHTISPPAGSVGDPFTNSTCIQSGCHGGTVHTATASDLTLNIGTGNPTTPLNSSFTYTPGTQYNIAFSILDAATSNPYYGFQIVALNSSNAQVGTMTVSNAATTQINTGAFTGTRQYMGHRSANSTRNWVFKWTAPASCSGAVTFYYAFNVANATEVPPVQPVGTVYKNSVTINCSSTGIEDISDKVSELNIFPNPINNDFNIAFVLKEPCNVSSQLYSIEGKLIKELINEKISEGSFNEQYDIRELPLGIYMVKLNVGDASVTKRILKQ